MLKWTQIGSWRKRGLSLFLLFVKTWKEKKKKKATFKHIDLVGVCFRTNYIKVTNLRGCLRGWNIIRKVGI